MRYIKILRTIITMNKDQLQQYIQQFWEQHAIPGLMDFIRIPNQSPEFDPDWEHNGHMDNAARCVINWCHTHAPTGMEITHLQEPGRTPLILINIPGQLPQQVLFYGHIDKQPPGEGWAPDLGPYDPVIKDQKLYGRGTVDDGYAVFTAITAIRALQAQELAHPSIQILLEASEESGSIDLPYYLDKYADQFTAPDTLICLDSGCGDYDRLWITTSLRGMIAGNLRVTVLEEGMHSGLAGGMVPSAGDILMKKLQAVCSPSSNQINLPALQATIPPLREQQLAETADILGASVYTDIPLAAGVSPLSTNSYTLLAQQTWGNAAELIGIDGIPSIANAGNVHRAEVTAKVSIRLPPTCAAADAAIALQQIWETDPPYGAQVAFTPTSCNDGWHGTPETVAQQQAFSAASRSFFGHDCAYMGEGGSIPIINLLASKFPKAHYIVTGILGPHGNAHGPNEFVSIKALVPFTACIACLIR